MTTRFAGPVSTPSTASYADLDAELARWLRLRATSRAEKNREASPLDGLAVGLRRVRAALDFLVNDGPADARTADAVSRTYRWAIRVARELEAIEQMDLDPIEDWTRFEAFAPFALAFYDSALAPIFVHVGTSAANAPLLPLRRALDTVLDSIGVAMTSSACAA